MKKNKLNKNEMEVEEKEYTFFEKLTYLFIIPVLVIFTIALGILTYFGINIFELAKEMRPKVETVTSHEEEKLDSSNDEKKTDQNNANQTIVQLERELQDKQNEILKLQEQLKNATLKIDELEMESVEISKSIKELSNMYERMPTRKAAQIMVELEEDLALKILANLSANKVSAVLAQLEPAVAAKFTKKLADE
ncbi:MULTISPECIES: MotE family protein [Bacillus]|uniref:MotE family protein n=1 Tax=Bacillus TaxID=1386 RepID=UPI000BB92923|nr:MULTISPECIES: hypothetical protein [Bacillus]